ncbi:Uncharacterised protein [Burkholderia pseudomallei]|nr:Uncharacterised protein [Burkholderia pseudomallei]
MVEHLRAHEAALRPRRHDRHRHARAEAVRQAVGRVAAAAARVHDVVDLAVDGHGRQALRARRRRLRRHDVIEEAVVLVVHDEEHGLAPHVGVRRQRVEDLRRVVRAVRGRVSRMLGERRGRQQPRHLRQLVREHVGLQIVERARRLRAPIQRRARLRVDEVREVLQDVRPVVAVQRIGPRRALLIDLPRNAVRLEAFGVRRPGEQIVFRRHVAVHVIAVVEQRAAVPAGRIDRARHQIRAVRMRRARQRAEVVVADGERVGERVVERDVLAHVVAHRHVGLVRGPLIVAAAVDRRMRLVPRVIEIADALCARRQRVQAKRQHRLARIRLRRLIPDRFAVRQRNRKAVVVAAHTAQVSEVMVERAVFLHEHDDVLDIAQRARARRGGNRECAANRFGKHGERGGGARGLRDGMQETAAAF